MHENNLSLFISQIHFNRLWKMCFFNADILVKNLNLLIYSNYTSVYNFIYDRLAAKSAALKPLSQHLILCTFRYFLRKWQKISGCWYPYLSQEENTVHFWYGIGQIIHLDKAEYS